MSDPISRRQLLGRAALGGAALSLPGVLAACSGSGGAQGKAETSAATRAGASTEARKLKNITISNWPLYIDIDEKTKKRPTIEDFEKKYDVKVSYIEDVNDNEAYFAKVQAPLSQGQGIDRDLMVLTDWMAARMVRLGYVQRKDMSAIPNEKNLRPALRHPKWDPNRAHSLPWQSFLAGIAYNPKLVGGDVTTVDQLFTDPKLKGKVTCLTEMPDTMGLVMLSNGDDPTKVQPAAFDRAIDKLQKAVDSGQIRQFTGNDYAPLLAKGDIWAAFAWSGDIVQLQLDNPDLKFVLPRTGGMIFTDNMLIPLGGDVYTASVFMNFVYDPKIAAQIEDYVNYVCPVIGARDVLLKSDPAVAKNPLVFPTPQMLANAKQFDTTAADNKRYREKFQSVIGA